MYVESVKNPIHFTTIIVWWMEKIVFVAELCVLSRKYRLHLKTNELSAFHSQIYVFCPINCQGNLINAVLNVKMYDILWNFAINATDVFFVHFSWNWRNKWFSWAVGVKIMFFNELCLFLCLFSRQNRKEKQPSFAIFVKWLAKTQEKMTN